MLLRGILLFLLLSSVFAMLNAVYKWFGFPGLLKFVS